MQLFLGLPDLLAALFRCYKELSFLVKLVFYLSLLVGQIRVFFVGDSTFKVRRYERQCLFVSSSVTAKIAPKEKQ